MEQPVRRIRVKNLNEYPDHKWAVFTRSRNGQVAQFSVIHATQEKALEVARTHAADCVANAEFDRLYFVVELKHKVGFDNGKPTDTAL